MNLFQRAPLTYQRHQGFTLIELLVVVIIIAIVSGSAILTLNSSDASRLQQEAQRLRLVLQQSADSALMQQQTLGWYYREIDNGGLQYQVDAQANSKQWQQQNGKLFSAHTLTNLWNLSVKSSTVVESVNNQPQLVFYHSGEYSPFQLTLRYREHLATLHGDGLSQIKLTLGTGN